MEGTKVDINITRMISTKRRSEFAYTINALNIIYNNLMKDRTPRTKPTSDITRPTATGSQHWVSPVIHNLCTTISTLEYSDSTILTSSRLTATTLTFLCLLSPGDHVLVTDSVYYPLKEFCNVLPKLNINVDYFNPKDEYSLKTLLRTNTKLVHLESPCSDTFEVLDVDKICKYVKQRSGKCIISLDNSWATPLIYKPLIHGVDVSICDVTNYLMKQPTTDLTSISTTKTLSHMFTKFNNLVDLTCGNYDLLTILNNLNTSIFRLYQRYNPIVKICRHLYAMKHLCQVFCPALPSSSDHGLWQQKYNLLNNTISIKLNENSIDKCKTFLSNLTFIKTDGVHGDNKTSASLFVIRHRLFGTESTYPIIRLQIGSDNVDGLITDLTNALTTTG
ncbi:cystathionine beta-lyase [Candidatus Hodgkinia cicadicola]|uniref:Cystathionine beta-lyase n=1 Tax=Candidatus Hodgkinia cicadicola TaxID=573658 RepID=A0ABX4MER3_9HYPH|nr:cystathionine beta-lyase [Candidatus Hodgkinia cicadicola]PIM96532.1 cystathionine beta-lyase [Candidatus Hodgkinia cicadicola]